MRVRGFLLLSLAVSASLLWAASGAAAANASVNDLDVQIYARQMGVSVAEANRELTIQPETAALANDLAASLGASFAGFWIQHVPDYRLVVATTGSTALAEAAVQQAQFDPTVPVDIISARYSLADLVAVSQDLSSESGRPWDLSVNVQENRVELRATSETDVVGFLRTQGRSIPPEARIVTVQHLATKTASLQLGGGVSTYTCTIGFSVIDRWTNLPAYVSAGHCGTTSLQLSFLPYTQLPFLRRQYGGSDDEGLFGEATTTPRNWVYDSSGQRSITGEIAKANQQLGWYVCKFGRVSGYTCGTIDSLYFYPAGVPGGGFPQFVHVAGASVAGGDSGGPVYTGNSALGLIQGTMNFTDLIYTPIDRVEMDLGCTLMRS